MFLTQSLGITQLEMFGRARSDVLWPGSLRRGSARLRNPSENRARWGNQFCGAHKSKENKSKDRPAPRFLRSPSLRSGSVEMTDFLAKTCIKPRCRHPRYRRTDSVEGSATRRRSDRMRPRNTGQHGPGKTHRSFGCERTEAINCNLRGPLAETVISKTNSHDRWYDQCPFSRICLHG